MDKDALSQEQIDRLDALGVVGIAPCSGMTNEQAIAVIEDMEAGKTTPIDRDSL